MKTTSLLRLAAAPGALAIAAFATPAFAQEDRKPPASTPMSMACATMPPGVSSGASIVVTGSRIRQPNLELASPVTVITGDQLFETGSVSIGDQLNDLPQLRSTFSQPNSTRFLGTRGLSLLDLRGLGTQRTLVLVNGRRHVAGDVLRTASRSTSTPSRPI